MEKLYAVRTKMVDSNGNAVMSSNGKSQKVDTKWYDSFTEVKNARGRVQKVGTGNQVNVTKTPAAIERGVYVNMDTITDAELAHLKSVTNVKRMLNPRYIGTVKMIRALCNTVKNPMVEMSDTVKRNLLDALANEFKELERLVLKGKKEKAVIAGLI